MNETLIREYVNTGSMQMCYAHYATKSLTALYCIEDLVESRKVLRDELDACMAAIEIIFKRMESDCVDNTISKKI